MKRLKGTDGVTLVLLVCALAFPLVFHDQSLQNVATLTLLYAAIACAWNIAGGYSGQMSFGHAAFFGVSAYVSGGMFVNWHISPWLGMLVGAGVAGLLGAFLGYIGAKTQGIYFVIITLAVAQTLQVVASSIGKIGRFELGAGSGIPIPLLGNAPLQMQFGSTAGYYYLCLGLLAAVFLFMRWMERAPLGYRLLAVREEPDAAEAMGVNVVRSKVVAMAISAAFVGAAGTVLSQLLLLVDPVRFFDIDLSLQMVTMSVLGGPGTLLGPVIGAIILQPLGELIRSTLGGTLLMGGDLIAYGLLLVVVITFLPSGIWPLIERALGKARRVGLPEADEAVLFQAGGEAAADRPLVEVKHAGKSFGGLQAVADVSFDVAPGEIVGVIGPNGAGKTTLFNLIAGAERTSAGDIVFRGRPLGTASPHTRCELGIARTFQVVRPLRKLTVWENTFVAALCRTASRQEAERAASAAVHFVGLWHRAHQPASELSIADLKRLEVARALASRPQVLLLDEMMSGLTPLEAVEIVGIVRRINSHGVALVVIEHVMDIMMNLCPRILVLKSGSLIAEGPPQAIAHNPEVIEAYLGQEYGRARA